VPSVFLRMLAFGLLNPQNQVQIRLHATSLD